MLVWKNYSLYDSSTDFRRFWVQSKLAETSVATVGNQNRYRFLPVPAALCTLESFAFAYPVAGDEVPPAARMAEQERRLGFRQDGILLYNRHSHYNNDTGENPLCMQWKDINTTDYFVDTASRKGREGGVAPQTLTLELGQDLKLRCVGGEVLGDITLEVAQRHSFQPGELLRFTLQEATEEEGPDGAVHVRDDTVAVFFFVFLCALPQVFVLAVCIAMFTLCSRMVCCHRRG